MHSNIKVLSLALLDMDMVFFKIPHFPDGILVKGHTFIRATTPFNTESVSLLCRDKDAVYKLLDGVVPQPLTKSFLDPFGKYPALAQVNSLEEIVKQSSGFLYPKIVKMNQGEKGSHVFLVGNDKEFETALRHIFDTSSRYYDYIALVQEYIQPKRELRVLVASGKPVFIYDRETCEIVSGKVSLNLLKMSKKIITIVNLSWGAIDFMESSKGSLFFLEVNTKPTFDGFIQVQGDKKIKELYKKALKKLLL